MNRIWIFALLLFFPFALTQAATKHPLKINVFSRSNGAGLEAHRKLLRNALESLGHTVFDREYDDRPTRMHRKDRADINIFMEIISPQWFDYAKYNWLIPHPEFYCQDLALLNRIDLIVCLTHEAQRIFRELGKLTYFTGFTSFDCYNDKIEKDYNHFLHAPGASYMKGSNAIIELWRDKKWLPQLTVIYRLFSSPFTQENFEWFAERIPQDKLRHFQNNCGFHLCPSLTEGFGHYIMEAMSAGAVVITTDAPPMNEFIKDKRCLVPSVGADKYNLATCYYVSPEGLGEKIDALQSLPESELKQIGDHNRAIYLQMTQEFRKNLKNLLKRVNQN